MTYLAPSSLSEGAPSGSAWSTTAKPLGSQMLNNMVPTQQYRKAFAAEVQLDKQSEKILQQSIGHITKESFAFLALADVKTGDAPKLQ